MDTQLCTNSPTAGRVHHQPQKPTHTPCVLRRGLFVSIAQKELSLSMARYLFKEHNQREVEPR